MSEQLLDNNCPQDVELFDSFESLHHVAPTGWNLASWFFAAVVTQSAWGLYSVCCRFLQTKSQFNPKPFQLSFTLNALGLACSLLLLVVRTLIHQYHNDQYLFEAVPPWRLPAFRHQQLAYSKAGLPAAACLTSLAFFNILSARFTKVYWEQLIFLQSPLLVALLARIVYKEHIDQRVWTALLFTSVGAVLVVLGGITASPSSSAAISLSDALGLAFAVVATLSLALFILLVHHTKGLVSESYILRLTYCMQLSLSLTFSWLLEHPTWRGIALWEPLDWALWAFAGAGVFFGASLLQQVAIRRIGGPLFATFLAVRLVAACAGSSLLLREEARSALQGVGMGVIALTTTWFLYTKCRSSAVA